MEHVQEKNKTDPLDTHFFLVGAGALLDSTNSVNFVLGREDPNNACFNNNSQRAHTAHCYFHWATKSYNGAYAQLETSKTGVNIKYIESDSDRVMYEYTVAPRF